MTKRRSASEWVEIIAEWRGSGLSGREFADAIGTTASTLSWWAWKLEKQSKRQRGRRVSVPVTPAMSFLPVRLAPRAQESSEVVEAPLELEFGGCTVRLRSGFADATLERVLAVLKRAWC